MEISLVAEVAVFVAIGFLAQIVDGAIGMAYGLTATSILLSLGHPPAVASASIHAAEMFTSAASGTAHWRLGNVDKALFKRLVVPGMIGGALGAFVLVSLPGKAIAPFVSAYLGLMGCLILWRALRRRPRAPVPPLGVSALGGAGGLLDAIGGGGWGPIVTSTLIGHGIAPRFAIGSANAAEFFVTTVISATFVATIGLELWPIIAGLILGGVLAAPFAALVARHMPERIMMVIAATAVIVLAVRGVVQAAI